MGRFYSGDIEGKFWVGIQTSDDIVNLINNIRHIPEFTWKVCNCQASPFNDDYCTDCYSSKEEHINDIIQEDENGYKDNCLYYEDSEIIYELNKNTHYQELHDNMNKLKLQINPNIIQEFEKIEQTDEILNAFSGVFNKSTELLSDIEHKKEHNELCVLVARYILGYQITYCLNKKESCTIYCEV